MPISLHRFTSLLLAISSQQSPQTQMPVEIILAGIDHELASAGTVHIHNSAMCALASSTWSEPHRASSTIIYIINAGTVCVCVCVCPSPRDLGNGMSYRRTSFAGVKRFSWQVAQLLFKHIRCVVREEKSLELFGRLRVKARACTLHVPVYPGQDERCTPFERRWNILKGHGSRSWYCFSQRGWLKKQPLCERVTTSLVIIH